MRPELAADAAVRRQAVSQRAAAHAQPTCWRRAAKLGMRAAGAVGSMVGQIAKIKGCRAVGIAGGAEKCRRLIEDYGFDAAVDYRGKDIDTLTKEIGEAAPDGVDIIFENVGGDIL